MFTKRFEQESNGDLRLDVPAGADFKPVILRTRVIESDADATAYRREATEICREACGVIACSSSVSTNSELRGDPAVRVPVSAVLYCKLDDKCPLDEPPAHDPERIKPSPNPPSLVAYSSVD